MAILSPASFRVCLAACLWLVGLAAPAAAAPVGSPKPQSPAAADAPLPGHRVDSEHFRLYSDAPLADAPGLEALLEKTRERFVARMRRAGFRPEWSATPLTWVCFVDSAQYDRYLLADPWGGGPGCRNFYSAGSNRVVLWLAPAEGGAAQSRFDGVIAAHEATHQLAFNSGLMRRGVTYPLWAAEGLACTFEEDGAGTGASASDDVGIVPSRAVRLRRMVASEALVPLDRFVSLTSLDGLSDERICDLYAEAGALFAFLLNRHPAELRGYLASMARLAPGLRGPAELRAQFDEAFGALPELSAEWERFLATQAPPIQVADAAPTRR